MNVEHRTSSKHGAKIEKRADGKNVITGYAAVFYDSNDPGTEYSPWEDFCERIMPQAFDRALRERQDVVGAVNHDHNQLLGRTSSGTMTLSVDRVGLRYEIEPGETRCAADTMESLKRGDISGSSFAFVVRSQKWTETDQRDIREIHDVDLIDVGPVVNPAYKATSAGLRSQDEQSLKAEIETRRKARFEAERIDIDLALMEMDEHPLLTP